MPTSDKRKYRKAEYRNLRTMLVEELDRIMDSEEIDIHRAFVLKTARVFSSTGSGFSLTDGRNEWGIDFCREDPPVFTLAQCKCPEREFLESEKKPKQYDRDAVEDLLTGITFVLDTENVYQNALLEIKHFKNAYHESLREWEKETSLQAGLAIFGELTPQADGYFRNQKNSFKSRGVDLLLWDWQRFNDLLTVPDVDVETMKLSFTVEDPEKELLRRRSPVCVVRGIDLVNAWIEYQWRLVDWNVRAEIEKSPTNQRIRTTLMSPGGRRHFQDYNNGLLLVCKKISYRNLPGKKLGIYLRQPQVINGCQTLLSLYRAYMDLSEKDKEHFRENVLVQLKVIENQPPDYVERIILSTNDQNPMSPRSLKSNAPEQRKLQTSFRSFFAPYFYERKDCQFNGLLNFGQKTPWFRPAEYQVKPGKKRYRVLDNEALGQEWLAFIGYSHRTLRGGAGLFDNDELYRNAFSAHPKREFWQAVIKKPRSHPPVESHESDELFEDGSPSVYEYMLAHTIAVLVNRRKISFRKNRAAAIKRLIEKGALTSDASGKPAEDAPTVESNLLKDEKYLLGTVINNMGDVIVELFAMILCLRYGPLDDQRCGTILRYPPIRVHVENPYAEIARDAKEADSKHVLNLIYEFIRFSLEQYVIKYDAVIRAQPRLKSYLAQRNTVDKFRDFLLDINEEKTPRLTESWCPGDCSFVDTLPEIKG